MRHTARYWCLWPGLREAWDGSNLASWCWATGLALGANLCLWGTWVAPHRIPTVALVFGWLTVAVMWIAGWWRDVRRNQVARAGERDAVDRGLFNLAQAEYLKGHWFEAQQALEELLRCVPDDADAWLMLATLHRHQQQPHAAAAILGRLELMPGAEKWRVEIERERQLLERRVAESSPGEEGTEVADDPGPERTEGPKGPMSTGLNSPESTSPDGTVGSGNTEGPESTERSQAA